MALLIGKVKISNAHRGLRFDITPNDIRNGQPNDPCNCAAARALKRHFNAKETYVYRDVTYVLGKDGNALRYKTSAPLRLETIVFDRQGQFYPGQYELGPAPLTHIASGKKKSASAPARGRNSKPREYRPIPNVRPTASQKLPGA